MPTLITPHIINGIVYDIYGNSLANATITVTHSSITPVLSDISQSDGSYKINLGQLSSQWSVGDSISVKASKSGEGRVTVNTTISNKGGTKVNLTLEETSDYNFEAETMEDRRGMNLVIPTLFDGTKITRSNRLPVDTDNVLEKYQAADEDTTSTTQYFGFTDRLGNWYIQRYNTTTGTFRYAIGTSIYSTAWTNRTSQDYKYFHDAF